MSPCLGFTEMLGIQTQFLIHFEPALYPLSCLHSPCESILGLHSNFLNMFATNICLKLLGSHCCTLHSNRVCFQVFSNLGNDTQEEDFPRYLYEICNFTVDSFYNFVHLKCQCLHFSYLTVHNILKLILVI